MHLCFVYISVFYICRCRGSCSTESDMLNHHFSTVVQNRQTLALDGVFPIFFKKSPQFLIHCNRRDATKLCTCYILYICCPWEISSTVTILITIYLWTISNSTSYSNLVRLLSHLGLRLPECYSGSGWNKTFCSSSCCSRKSFSYNYIIYQIYSINPCRSTPILSR